MPRLIIKKLGENEIDKDYNLQHRKTHERIVNYDYDDDNHYEDVQSGGAIYTSISKTDYKKPKGPSKQDTLTLNQIRKKLNGYAELNTMKEKSILQYVQPFRAWLRYYDTKTEKFRIGGLLMKVDFPNYVTLVNTKNNISWSVQLKDNIIYIQDAILQNAQQKRIETKRYKPKTYVTETQKPKKIERKERAQTEDVKYIKRTPKKDTETEREYLIKEKLYDLFLKGKLKVMK